MGKLRRVTLALPKINRYGGAGRAVIPSNPRSIKQYYADLRLILKSGSNATTSVTV